MKERIIRIPFVVLVLLFGIGSGLFQSRSQLQSFLSAASANFTSSSLLYTSNAQEQETPSSSDFIPRQPTNWTISKPRPIHVAPNAVPQQSNDAYVFLNWGCIPELSTQNYRWAILHALNSAKLLKERYNSSKDVVLVVSLSYKSNMTQLLPIEEQLLKAHGVRLYYLDKLDETEPVFAFKTANVYFNMFKKFWLWTLDDYDKILYLDVDILPLRSMDYWFELSEKGYLNDMVVLAGHTEPANGGSFLIRPSQYEFEKLYNLLYKLQTQGKLNRRGGQPKNVYNAWDMPIDPNNFTWINNRDSGHSFGFFAAGVDQGLLYHYCRFMLRNCTQILGKGRSLQFFDPDGGIRQLPWEQSRFVGLKIQVSEPNHRLFDLNWKCRNFAGGSCVRPWQDFHHWTGDKKPWKTDKQIFFHPPKPEVVQAQPPKSIDMLWWHNALNIIQDASAEYRPWFEAMFPEGYLEYQTKDDK